jgi:hypothetical protein
MARVRSKDSARSARGVRVAFVPEAPVVSEEKAAPADPPVVPAPVDASPAELPAPKSAPVDVPATEQQSLPMTNVETPSAGPEAPVEAPVAAVEEPVLAASAPVVPAGSTLGAQALASEPEIFALETPKAEESEAVEQPKNPNEAVPAPEPSAPASMPEEVLVATNSLPTKNPEVVPEADVTSPISGMPPPMPTNCAH